MADTQTTADSVLVGLLACPSCGAPLEVSGSAWSCPGCGRTWRADGPLLLPDDAAPTKQGLTAASESFFDAYAESHGHHHEAPRESTPDDADLNRWLSRLSAYDPTDRLRALARECTASADASGAVLVELGCGHGDNLSTAAEGGTGGWRALIGCDVSVGALRRAAARLGAEAYAGRVALIRTTGGRPPVVSASADLVLLIHVLHHAGDLALLGEAHRIVRPGGHVFVVDLSSDNPLYSFCRAVWPWLPRGLRRRFTNDLCLDGEAPTVRLVRQRELDAEAARVGLTLERREGAGVFLFLFHYAAIALPAVARRVPRPVWRALYSLEKWALGFEAAASRTVGVARVYVRAKQTRE